MSYSKPCTPYKPSSYRFISNTVELFRALPEDVSQLTEAQKDVLILTLLDTVEQLEARIRELEAQLGKDSHNSRKPPSSDGLKKPTANEKSLRPKHKRKVGGQVGHKGQTLKCGVSHRLRDVHGHPCP